MVRRSWIALLLIAACSRAGEESEAKRSPKTPPPPEVDIPADLRIEVDIDGKPAEPITRERLAASTPDFTDGERSAWKLSALLGPAFDRPGTVVEAVARDGQGILLHRPDQPDGPLPVLFFTRRGEVVAALVDADEPFPGYHGQGGRLQRPGDRRPRLSDVVRLRVRAGEAGGANDADRSAAGRQALLGLELVVAGKPVRLTAEQIAALPRKTMQGDEGDQRTAWSLRAVAAAAAAPGARVTSVTGEAGPVAVPPARWADAALDPILRANRRGELKLLWLDPRGGASLEGEVRAVTRIEIQP